MANDVTAKKYRIKEVMVRLAEGSGLYSDRQMDTPDAAVEVMKKELSQYDREVLVVVNLNSHLNPINFNIVSVGDLTSTIASIPNLLVSGILSNSSSFLVLHNHPSGDLTPSAEDIAMTRRVIEAGNLIGIPCVDHIIVAGGNSGRILSMRESGTINFNQKYPGLSAADARVGESREEYQMDKMNGTENRAEIEELSIKFGKGLWVKLPSGAHITVTKPVAVGVENGKTVWNNEKKSVSVPELKSMVEFYKTKGRDSVMGQLGDMKKTAGEKAQTQPTRQKKRAEMVK
ncbi:MAG: JAB domain-containing protein [Lachnospiraceae bacterium]|nr:JAB domain-containing protein [Lachnospiraceae bacterium]